ncbi:MAG: hypothetical protein JST22_01875 [Bacteroidetes bacterium]|nr:hypothetical protein [Bacteroidota bacterium]
MFVAHFGLPLEQLPSPAWLQELLHSNADAPVCRTEEVRQGVRSMLRHAGYKPTGRGKPAAEYLVRAEEDGVLASINSAVDACNVVSLHSGLPISLVDLDRTRGPLRIGVAPEGVSYIFNLSGQSIDLGGLLCLFDAEGPCANAVKDSQRTKTSGATTRALSIIWGVCGFEEHTASAERWYRFIVERLGGECR